MKKWLALLVCAFIALSLFASDFWGEFKKAQSYVPDHVYLYTGNDLFSYGISRNDDDQLSYSFDFQVEAPLWYMRFNANGITNRGWRDGWDMTDYSKPYNPGASVVRGRYDSLETVVGMKLRPIEDLFYIHLYPEVGFALVGNYGWEWGQNAIHRMMGIHEVSLPYDTDVGNGSRLMLGLRSNLGYKFLNYERTSLIAEVEASTKNILGFQTENQILGRISVSTKTHDLIGFHFGYMYAAALDDETSYTQDLYLRYLNGLRLGFAIDTGILFLKYTATPHTNYGYGYLGFDVMGFFKPRTWEKTDAFMLMSNASFYGRYYHIISLGIPLPGNFVFMFKNSYLGGDPLSPTEEAESDLNKVIRYKRDYSFFTLGVRYNFPELVYRYITPYLELTAGLQKYVLYDLNNQLDDEAIGSIDTPSEVWDFLGHYYGLVSLEGGVSVLPESLVVFQDTSIQIELFGGVNMILGGDTFDISVYREIHKLWEGSIHDIQDMGLAARFIPYYGFGVKLGFDL